MSASYLEILQDVKTDRKSGAWVIAQKTIDCLQALAAEKAGGDVSDLVSEVERVAAEVLKARHGMALLTNLFNAIFVTIESESSRDARILSRKIAGEATRFDENSHKAVSQVAGFGADLINPDAVVLIHGNSSTVFEIIKKALGAGKSFQVILTESRPMCEGRTCATELSNIGVQSLYLVDAAVSMGVERADVVLLGADSMFETMLVNKIGAKSMALLAREAVVPCYAACESSKFMPQKLSPKKEQPRDPDEVWEEPPAETTIENYYFEDVPLDLFTGIITEEGVLTPSEISGKIRSLKLNTRLLKMIK